MEKCNCGKEFEKKNSLKSHARFCKSYVKKEKPIFTGECECGKNFKSSQSLNAHYSHCIIHRNGKEGVKRGGWNVSSEARKKGGKTYSEKILSGEIIPSFKGKKHSKETREKLSMSSKGWTNGYIKTKFYEIFCPFMNEIIKVQGTYELEYATKLNNLKIDWIKSRKIYIKYNLDIQRTYFPDFYLPFTEEYIEIKGYFREEDKIKMHKVIECNPDKKIKILMLDDIRSL